jgi:hyaluronan synthase
MRTSTTTATASYPLWRPARPGWDRFYDLAIKVLIPLGVVAALFIGAQLGSFDSYTQIFDSQRYNTPLLALGSVYGLAFLIMQLIRTVYWVRYRAYPLPDQPLPRVSVIIPAYNEGAMVEKSIYSVAASDYPADRLEIFCIDDGSKDDTWEYIDRAAKRLPGLIKTIRFPANRGKREALYAGFKQATGQYLVTVDSDSVIQPDTIKQVVAPMVHNPKIGAVAGNVKVYNRHANLLTRMVFVRFVLSFDFLRASQSLYGCVYCTPGALSAYRREAIWPVLEEWRHQTFLGRRCNIGEDRAFTNLVLRQGYYTFYQRSAVVYTTVPEHYRGLSKMFLRWDRSNFRESYIQLKYVFTRYRDKHRLMPILDLFMRESEFPMIMIFVPLLLVAICLNPLVLLKVITGMMVVSFVLYLYYVATERDLDFVYGVLFSFYNFFLLRWIKPYAFFTLKDGRWMTR